MFKLASSLTATILTLLCWQVAPAQAQLARTFVSSLGNDANDCNRLTPCRTFQRAHDATLAAGEITVLDPGGYGAVTITKTISIINDGVGEAGTLVSGGLNGITIAAGGSDTVSLRGLTIKGIGFGGGNGIVFNTGKSLTVENCAIRNLTGASPIGNGILFQPTVSSHLAVSNTFVADNSTSGIHVFPTGTGLTVRAVFNRLETYGNGSAGLFVSGDSSTGTINATAVNSVTASNVSGIIVGTIPGGSATSVMLSRSVVANSATNGAFVSGPAAILRMSQSTVTGNAFGWSVAGGGTLLSYVDNSIDGNNGSELAPPPLAKK